MVVQIRNEPFDAYAEVQIMQDSLEQQGKFGATSVFVGTMRDFNEDESVQSMFLEHYPGMTEKYLTQISQQAKQNWPIIDSLIIHRVGQIEPGDSIVLVAVWAAHRAAAYDANRYLMEELKSRAPFWKKEQLNDGQRWVEKNTPS
ncbi:MAG: molybdenum cofactor biosynthesis protein MoaE [Gammaproteobacteria bacterium]|nr:molybdenum cofactor biosynthesis protein MoaE [Gammaproteobacteria bacterium]